MGEIYFRLEIESDHLKVNVNAFLDTGSSYNVIEYELYDGTPVLGLMFESYDAKGSEIILPNKTTKEIFGTITFKSIIISWIKITNRKFTTFTLNENSR